MPQTPLGVIYGQAPDGTTVRIQTDADGNIIVVSDSGGEAVSIADGADITQGAKADSAWASGAGSVVALLKAIATPIVSAVALGASSGNVANAAAVATLHPASGKTAFISGFQVTASGSTTALPVIVTVSGLKGGTQSFIFTFPAGVLIAAQPLIVSFPTPLAAAAVDTDIVVTLPAGGVGNTNAAASANGFYK